MQKCHRNSITNEKNSNFEEKEAKSQTYAQKSSNPGEFASVWISMPLCAKGFLCAVSGFGEVSSPSVFSSSLSPTPLDACYVGLVVTDEASRHTREPKKPLLPKVILRS